MIKHRSHRVLAVVGCAVAAVLTIGGLTTSAVAVPAQQAASTSDAWAISEVGTATQRQLELRRLWLGN